MKRRAATTKALPRIETDRTVYEASCERYAKLFREFDTVIVMFSGGKDSTSALHCALDAREAVGGELTVWFFDEEVIPPETVEYVERISPPDYYRPDFGEAELGTIAATCGETARRLGYAESA